MTMATTIARTTTMATTKAMTMTATTTAMAMARTRAIARTRVIARIALRLGEVAWHNAPRKAAMLCVGLALVACVEKQEFTPAAPTVPQPRLPRNDAYEGSVITRKLQPKFVWEEAQAQRGPIVYELQYSPDVTFTADVTTIQTPELTYQPPDALAVSTVPPVGRRYYWRVRACLERSCSDYSRPWWVNLGRSSKDFNGDGYADVAVSAPTHATYGGVFIYFGGPLPLNAIVDGTISSPVFVAGFGGLATGGDANGDGFADLVVGHRSVPKAWVYYGGAGQTLDGNYDIEMRVGSATYLRAMFTSDLDGDYKSDILVSDPSNSLRGASAGAVHVFTGTDRPAGPNQFTIFGRMAEEYVGFRSPGVGDVTGDGLPDILLTPDRFYDEIHAPPCLSRLYHSVAPLDAEVDFTFFGDTTAGYCSFGAIIIDDLNGDGISDIVTAENSYVPSIPIMPGFRRIRSYLMNRSGEPKSLEPFEMNSDMAVLYPAGDLNGDGYYDLAVASERTSTILFGSPRGVSEAGRLPHSYVVASGDLNGDGYDDLLSGDVNLGLWLGGPGGTFNESQDGLFPGM